VLGVAARLRRRVGVGAGEGEAAAAVERAIAEQLALREIGEVSAVINHVRVAGGGRATARGRALEYRLRAHRRAAHRWVRLPAPSAVVAP
jgi:hypothetical protein